MPEQTADKTMMTSGEGERATREKGVCYWIRLKSQVKMIKSI